MIPEGQPPWAPPRKRGDSAPIPQPSPPLAVNPARRTQLLAAAHTYALLFHVSLFWGQEGGALALPTNQRLWHTRRRMTLRTDTTHRHPANFAIGIPPISPLLEASAHSAPRRRPVAPSNMAVSVVCRAAPSPPAWREQPSGLCRRRWRPPSPPGTWRQTETNSVPSELSNLQKYCTAAAATGFRTPLRRNTGSTSALETHIYRSLPPKCPVGLIN